MSFAIFENAFKKLDIWIMEAKKMQRRLSSTSRSHQHWILKINKLGGIFLRDDIIIFGKSYNLA